MVLWIFGYGSLVWKAGFQYEDRAVGYIKDYRRVFYQGCTDHRGTPDNPGRAVTLVPQEGSIVWGAAYKVSGHDAEQLVLSYLALREKDYDVRAYVDFFTADSSSEPALSGVLVYIGSPNKNTNKYFLGPASLEDMASQIARSVGPAGTNYEYLFRLEEALHEIGHDDEEVVQLANEVRKLLQNWNRNQLCCKRHERSSGWSRFTRNDTLAKWVTSLWNALKAAKWVTSFWNALKAAYFATFHYTSKTIEPTRIANELECSTFKLLDTDKK